MVLVLLMISMIPVRVLRRDRGILLGMDSVGSLRMGGVCRLTLVGGFFDGGVK